MQRDPNFRNTLVKKTLHQWLDRVLCRKQTCRVGLQLLCEPGSVSSMIIEMCTRSQDFPYIKKSMRVVKREMIRSWVIILNQWFGILNVSWV